MRSKINYFNTRETINIMICLTASLPLILASPTPTPDEISAPRSIYHDSTRILIKRDGLGTGGIVGLVVGGGALMLLILLCVTKLGRR